MPERGDVLTGQTFARKVMHLSPFVTQEDVENEGRAIDKLSSDLPGVNIVRVFRHGWMKSINGAQLPIYYVDMELGQCSLDDYIKQNSAKPKTVHDVFKIMAQVAAGVSFIHRKGMIHRDLKPANSSYSMSKMLILSILVIGSMTDLDQYVWKVADFGISTPGTSQRLIATRDARGTLHYGAPEILLSDADIPCYTNKVDIWGIGLILFELLTAKKAFQSANAVMRYFWDQDPCPRVTLSASVKWTDLGRILTAFWLEMDAVVGLEAGGPIPNSSFWARIPTDGNADQSDFDKQIKWLLHKTHGDRPAIEEVLLHFTSMYIRDNANLDVSSCMSVAEISFLLGTSTSVTLLHRRVGFSKIFLNSESNSSSGCRYIT